MPFGEPNDLCETCQKKLPCLGRAVSGRQACDEYEPLSLDELVENDRIVASWLVGACPGCGSEHTSDCDSRLETARDPTKAYCFECGTYWCLACGYVFRKDRQEIVCPHWRICSECSEGYGLSLIHI